MKVTFYGGPLDGSEVEHDEDLPPVLIFPEHDSWDLLTEEVWLAAQEDFVYRVADLVTGSGHLPMEAHYRYEGSSA